MTKPTTPIPRDRKSVINRLIGYGSGIPADARVDPADFPEDEFPLYCPNCDYLLRGLTDPRCPECGRAFERGRLLVEQYAIEGGMRGLKRSVTLARRMFVIGCLLCVPFAILFGLMACIGSPGLTNRTTRMWDRVMSLVAPATIISGVGAAFIFASSVLGSRVATVADKKRKQVWKGIDSSTPSFKAAQRYRWIPAIIAATLFLVAIVSEARQCGSYLDYYLARPYRVILPIASATLAGILLLMGKSLFQRSADANDESDRRP